MAEKRRVVCPSCDSINAVPADRPAEAGRCGRCHAPLFQRRPIDVNASQLQKHIAESPVIVDFWARRGTGRAARWLRYLLKPPKPWSPERASSK